MSGKDWQGPLAYDESAGLNQVQIALPIRDGIGHEILNPLTTAMLSLNSLETSMAAEIKLSEKIAKNMQRLNTNLTRVSKIVKGLSSLARDADADPFKSVRLVEVWSNVYELASPRFKKSNIDLRVKGFDEDMLLECNPVQLEQIIINLVNNAFEAIEDAWIEVSVEKSNEYYLFRVRDCGRGIRKEVVDRMFEPMYTTKSLDRGTGLGLALVQKITDKHRDACGIILIRKIQNFVLSFQFYSHQIKM